MARKSKKTPARPQVDPTVLKRVTDAMLDIDGQKAELGRDRSEYSQEAKDALVHTKAHGWCLAALKMPAAERRLLLDCFDAYRSMLKLDDWQTEVDQQTDIEDAVTRVKLSDSDGEVLFEGTDREFSEAAQRLRGAPQAA